MTILATIAQENIKNDVLSELQEHGPSIVEEVAELVAVSNDTAKECLDKLLQEGYIEETNGVYKIKE